MLQVTRRASKNATAAEVYYDAGILHILRHLSDLAGLLALGHTGWTDVPAPPLKLRGREFQRLHRKGIPQLSRNTYCLRCMCLHKQTESQAMQQGRRETLTGGTTMSSGGGLLVP